MKHAIKSVEAREILSTSSFPTIEVKVVLEDGTQAVASAPYGSSEGAHEPLRLVDGDPDRYHGKGMLNVVENVKSIIEPALVGVDVTDQAKIDRTMVELDGTPNFAKLGGNAVTGVSLACARVASKANGLELFEYLYSFFEHEEEGYKFPYPMIVLIEGGQHADNSTDLQEYLIVCHTEGWSVDEWIREGIEVYQTLRTVLKENGYSVNVGYEGAFAPTAIGTNREPLELITEAIVRTGYELGGDISLAMDPAASEILVDDQYILAREGKTLSSLDLIKYYEQLVKDFSIVSIEDGLGEDDWDAWIALNQRLGSEIMIMGDDLTVTSKDKLQKAIKLGAVNSILIKPNQAGTLTELIETINLAKKHGLKVVVSHRGGGDTADTFIADLSVASDADMMKTGPSRSERTEKYNRLMEIADIVRNKGK